MLENILTGLVSNRLLNSLNRCLTEIICLLFLAVVVSGFSQSKVNTFLAPSDTLVSSRVKLVVVSQTVLTATALIGLNELWYSDYPKADFQFKNDNNHWLQMDKMGHVYASYHFGRISSEMLAWSGVSKKKQLLYGATYGFAFLTAVEVMDGYSEQWGFSWGDVAANATGTALYISQELLWNEQRLQPKFSFHTTSYAAQRPELLGSSLSEQILKDYNGQTYWLSANVHSFIGETFLPKWFNVAVGYGAEGMITAEPTPGDERYRQWYLSLDVDLTKIQTKSHFLKTCFSLFNAIKIPSPTIEISSSQGFKFHPIYF
jgi:uncharacterized protein YfiM (DUF2279 family)